MKKILSVLFFALSLVSVSPALAQDVVVDSILPVDECAYINLTLKFGSKDSATSREVAMLQKFLRDQGYMGNLYTKLDAPVAPSYAIFDDATRNGVKAFQKDYAMLVDGIVGSLTRREIKVLSCDIDSRVVFPINVLSQNEKSQYISGQLMKIKWINNVSPATRDVRVGVYSMDKGANMVFGAFITDSAIEKQIRIPANLPTGNYKVMVHEVLKDSVFGVSGVFKIKAPIVDETLPVISEVTGPATLNVDQIGMWTVNAYNPKGGALSYSVAWGDVCLPNLLECVYPETPQKSHMITHAYKKTGTFTLTFYATNEDGKVATFKKTVIVGNTYPVPAVSDSGVN